MAYVALSCLTHYVLIPEPPPSADFFPRQGHVIVNSVAGETVRILKDCYSGDPSLVEIDVLLEPGRSVPMPHIHIGMTEVFTALEEQTNLVISGNIRSLQPGESITIHEGVPHQPFNPGKVSSRVKVSLQPVGFFDLCLVSIHGLLTKPEEERGWLVTQMQLARYATFCNIYRVDIPVWLQQSGLFFADPTLRLLGFRRWEE